MKFRSESSLICSTVFYTLGLLSNYRLRSARRSNQENEAASCRYSTTDLFEHTLTSGIKKMAPSLPSGLYIYVDYIKLFYFFEVSAKSCFAHYRIEPFEGETLIVRVAATPEERSRFLQHLCMYMYVQHKVVYTYVQCTTNCSSSSSSSGSVLTFVSHPAPQKPLQDVRTSLPCVETSTQSCATNNIVGANRTYVHTYVRALVPC